MKLSIAALMLTALIGFAGVAAAADNSLTIASTTSTENSGLFKVLIPAYEGWTKLKGTKVKVVAMGSGKAIEAARRGDADMLFVHSKSDEERFVAEGYGEERIEVMYNDFVLVGPKDDPAGASDAKNAPDAFKKMADKEAKFVSRGDDSGTHKREEKLWGEARVDPATLKNRRSVGQGMGATLTMADEMGAYTLVDRATYNAMRKKLKNIRAMYQGGSELINQYSVIAVSKEKHPHTNQEAARDFITFVTSRAGQKVIGDFRDEHGGVMFVPNASNARNASTSGGK